MVCTAATPQNGSLSSIVIGTDGLAVVGFYDNAPGLRVTHCSNVACTSATSTTVDVGPVANLPDIAIGTDGLAIISHRDVGTNDLRVTHCSKVACTAATSINVDTQGDVGELSSIAIGTDGLPVISHYGNGLRVTKCSSRTCQ